MATGTGGKNVINGHLLILPAAVLWGTTGTSQALAPTGCTPRCIGALRLLVVNPGGLFATGLAFYLFCKGLELVQVSIAVTFSLAEPFTAAMLAFFLLQEQLSVLGITGLLLILSRLVILAIPSPKRLWTHQRPVN